MLARLATLAVIAVAGLTVSASSAEMAYTKSSANLREGPGISFDIVATLPKNTLFSVEACTVSWCAGESEDGDEGFVARSLLVFDDFEEIPDEPDLAEVCFYQQANYKGANFCVEEGDEDAQIPGSFNNNIESVLVGSGLRVELCSGSNYGGDCFYLTSSKKTLPSEIRNKATSYVVSANDDDDDEGDDDDGGEINIILLN